MKADGRFGGHIVQGHVDGVGKLIEFERILDPDGRDSENWWLHIEIPAEIEKYTVYKGSISIEASASPSPNWNAIAARSPSFPIR